MLRILAERWKQGHRNYNGNPGRVPPRALGTCPPHRHPRASRGLAKPSRALASPGKARLRLRDHGNLATRSMTHAEDSR
jgi:hypothetical protein